MKTWDEVVSSNDLVPIWERELIEKLAGERVVRCPYLEKGGRFFYFCKKGIPEGQEFEISPVSPIYQARQSVNELNFWCMGGFKACMVYRGVFTGPGEGYVKR